MVMPVKAGIQSAPAIMWCAAVFQQHATDDWIARLRGR